MTKIEKSKFLSTSRSYFHKRKKNSQISSINVVPYIDVMLVLLIIFMVTAPMLSQGVEVSLPNAKAATINTNNLDPIILSIKPGGAYYLNVANNPNTQISLHEIAPQVTNYLEKNGAKNEKINDRKIFIQGDKTCNYNDIVQAMVSLQKARFSNLCLVTSDQT